MTHAQSIVTPISLIPTGFWALIIFDQENIDYFFSHDWETSRLLKWLSLLVMFNSHGAAVMVLVASWWLWVGANLWSERTATGWSIFLMVRININLLLMSILKLGCLNHFDYLDYGNHLSRWPSPWRPWLQREVPWRFRLRMFLGIQLIINILYIYILYYIHQYPFLIYSIHDISYIHIYIYPFIIELWMSKQIELSCCRCCHEEMSLNIEVYRDSCCLGYPFWLWCPTLFLGTLRKIVLFQHVSTQNRNTWI